MKVGLVTILSLELYKRNETYIRFRGLTVIIMKVVGQLAMLTFELYQGTIDDVISVPLLE